MNRRLYRLEASQTDRMAFDEMVRGMAQAQTAILTNAELQALSPTEHRAQTEAFGALEFVLIPDDEADIDWRDTTLIYVDDLAEAQARFREEFEAAIEELVGTRLTDELYQSETGYTTTLIVRPGGQQDGLEFSAAAIEIVVLDADGSTVAYRYADDSRDEAWQVGTVEDAVSEWAEADRAA